MGVTWLTAFLDTPADTAEATEAFWVAVTGWPLSERRGPQGEFATLEPPDGDAVLKVQVVGEPPPGMLHLDVHVDDVAGESARAAGLGAEPHSDASLGYVVHRSPGGITFCLVAHEAGRRPGPVSWPAGHSLVDQVCLDVPGDDYEREAQFWADLLVWPRQPGAVAPFERLLPPDVQGLHVLVQRLDDLDGPARLHLDLAADDVAAEVGRHLDLGAQGVRVERYWTTLMDPAGRFYCVTERSPATGRLP